MSSRPPKFATPDRWQVALQRALKEGVRVWQSELTGAWVATSGTLSGKYYELEIFTHTEPPTITCTCEAAENNDPVCKHRARWYWEHDFLEIDDTLVKEKDRGAINNGISGGKTQPGAGAFPPYIRHTRPSTT
jgi:hypothetical protein